MSIVWQIVLGIFLATVVLPIIIGTIILVVYWIVMIIKLYRSEK